VDDLNIFLTSPLWWLSALVVGILSNIFAHYFQRLSADYLTRIYLWRNKRSSARVESHHKYLLSLVGNKYRQLYAGQISIRLMLQSVVFMLIGLFVGVVYILNPIKNDLFPWEIIPGFLTIVCFMMGLRVLIMASDIARCIRDARIQETESTNVDF